MVDLRISKCLNGPLRSSENIQMHQRCRILGLQNCLIDILFNDLCGSQNIINELSIETELPKERIILQTPGKVYSSYGVFRNDDSEIAVCMKKQILPRTLY